MRLVSTSILLACSETNALKTHKITNSTIPLFVLSFSIFFRWRLKFRLASKHQRSCCACWDCRCKFLWSFTSSNYLLGSTVTVNINNFKQQEVSFVVIRIRSNQDLDSLVSVVSNANFCKPILVGERCCNKQTNFFYSRYYQSQDKGSDARRSTRGTS
jgi:hypothetical protein